MKIATYNVWYENIHTREEQLLDEIGKLDADVVGLQEVPPAFYEKLTSNTKYSHCTYVLHDEEGSGLAILSKYPFVSEFSLFESAEHCNSIAQNVIFEAEEMKFSLTNVHLPWDSVLEKEKQIVAISQFVHRQKDDAHFFIMMGDFNCTMSSSVHHFLLGDRTLNGCESKPYWNDLASVHAALHNYNVAPTLDFVANPRWRGKNTNYIPETCDRIYILESFNWDYEFRLSNVEIFGKEVSVKTGLAPSDHYGVLASVDFEI